jgi:serine phosphatase RsbU (regulator of sigma subunit)
MALDLLKLRQRFAGKKEHRKPALILLSVIGFLAALYLSPAGTGVEKQLEQRFLFWARSKIGQGPGLSKQIKIFAYDDETAASEGDFDIPLTDWGLVFKALAERKPQSIVVDKIFDKAHPPDQIVAFQKMSREWHTPTSIISFVTSEKVLYRTEVPGDRPEHQIGTIAPDGVDQLPAWLRNMKPKYFYGAPQTLTASSLGVFSGIGHAVYELDGYLQSIYKINDRVFVPHVALVAGHPLKIKNQQIFSGENEVPTTADGRILVNVDKQSVYAQRSYGMGALIRRARNGKPITVVDEGDTVILLPLMYTGNTDFRETPHGSMPGGYLVAAMVNSSLTGKWLKSWNAGIPLIIAGGLSGAWIAFAFSPLMIGVISLAVIGISVVVCILLFSTVGILLPFALPLASFIVAAGVMFGERSRRAQVSQVRIEGELATAQIVQNSFFADKKTCHPDLTVTGKFFPAGECGGDWWGHCPAGPGKEYVFIGDATGHGVAAALVTAVSFATISAIESFSISQGNAENPKPSDLLKMLNKVLFDLGNHTGVMTFFVGLLDLEQNKFVYSNAGHLPPALLPLASKDPRIQGRLPIKNLGAPGSLLGMDPDSTFTDQEIELKDGDRLFIYTDGLIENYSTNNKNPFGKKRLYDALIANRDLAAKDFLSSVIKSYADHIAGELPADDTTLVVIDWKRHASHPPA